MKLPPGSALVSSAAASCRWINDSKSVLSVLIVLQELDLSENMLEDDGVQQICDHTQYCHALEVRTTAYLHCITSVLSTLAQCLGEHRF